jgi:ankyrin repeat protein
MDSFQTKLKIKTIKADLRALPKGLDAYDIAYHNAMSRIFGQEADSRETARKTLSLMLCAKRPFWTRELQHAMMIEDGDAELDHDAILEVEDILAVCAGLITIDKNSGTVRFVHYTTQEYLQRTQDLWLPGARIEIARTCLNYMLLREFASGRCNTDEDTSERTGKYTFICYAAAYGFSHMELVLQKEPTIQVPLLSLLTDPERIEVLWQMASENYWLDRFDFLAFWYERLTTAQWISHLGLMHLAKFGIVNGVNFDPETDSVEGSPLKLAASAGHMSMVELLLDHNVAINRGRSRPLDVAARGGHDLVVRLLLKHGAIIDPDNTLSDAVTGGHEPSIQLLLDNGADIDAGHDAPLLRATYSISSQSSIVHLLLQNNARVDPKSGSLRTPLSYAAEDGQNPIVRLLLQYHAVVDDQDCAGRTPLSYAASQSPGPDTAIGNDCEILIQLLLDHNADVNIVDKMDRSPLSFAARRPHEGCLRLLLNAGAVVDCRDNSGRTPLSYAAEKGLISNVQLLLEHQADIESASNRGWTPLLYAVRRGHDSTVRLLLKGFAITDSQSSFGATSLSLAADTDHDSTLSINHFLFQPGAFVDAKGNKGRTALSYAAGKTSSTILRCLIGHHASLDTQCDDGRTPLSYAAGAGRLRAVKLLLKKGADPNIVDHRGESALSYAEKTKSRGTVTALRDAIARR